PARGPSPGRRRGAPDRGRPSHRYRGRGLPRRPDPAPHRARRRGARRPPASVGRGHRVGDRGRFGPRDTASAQGERHGRSDGPRGAWPPASAAYGEGARIDAVEFPPVDKITAGAVGEPGERTFYLQARTGIELL